MGKLSSFSFTFLQPSLVIIFFFLIRFQCLVQTVNDMEEISLFHSLYAYAYQILSVICS